MYDESKHTQVTGTAVAVSGGAGATATVDWLPEASNATFQTVAIGTKLVLTDVVYYAQGDVTAPHTVNIAERNPNGTTGIMFQWRVGKGASEQVHYQTGHVIEAGKSVVVFTDANPPAGQHISLSINGYVAKIPRG